MVVVVVQGGQRVIESTYTRTEERTQKQTAPVMHHQQTQEFGGGSQHSRSFSSTQQTQEFPVQQTRGFPVQSPPVHSAQQLTTLQQQQEEQTLRRRQQQMSQQAYEQRQAQGTLQHSFNTSQGSDVLDDGGAGGQMSQLHIDTMQRSFSSQRSPSSVR